MSKDNRRLGRGLGALISPNLADPDQLNYRTAHPQGESSGHAIRMLRPDEIRPNQNQPRKHFDDASLARLANSLRERGAIQPIVVRTSDDGYELVAGERRWRAAKLAGLETIPAIIRPTPDGDLLELALIENLHREDLNPIERADAYSRLRGTLGITIEALAVRLGEDRATISNHIRLLELPSDVRSMVAEGRIGMGHARALLGTPDPGLRSRLATQIADEGWSVREVESRIRNLSAGKKPAAEPAPKRPAVADLEQKLTEQVGTRVRIIEGRKRHAGRIIIEYYSLDDFTRISARLGVEAGP